MSGGLFLAITAGLASTWNTYFAPETPKNAEFEVMVAPVLVNGISGISAFFRIKDTVENRDSLRAALAEFHDKRLLSLAELEVEGAERLTRPASKPRAKSASEYSAFLKAFLFFMRYGIKPDGILEDDFQLFRPLCERLVQKKQFKPEVLTVFETV